MSDGEIRSDERQDPTQRAANRLGTLSVSAAAVAWSTAGLFTRLIHVDAWTMLAWRGVFGATGLAAALLVMRQWSAWRQLGNFGWLGWLFVVQSAAGMIFFISALTRTSVAHVSVIYATVPFFAAALGWLVMKETPKVRAVAASCLALAGVVVMVGFGHDGGLYGDLLALGMTLTMAVAMVVARYFREMPFLPAACLAALLSGLVSWPLGRPMSISGHEAALLVLFGFVTFAIGLPLFTLGARHLPAIETALIGSLDAPLAPLWVWLALRETPSRGTILGGAIVFAAVAWHLLAENRFAARSA